MRKKTELPEVEPVHLRPIHGIRPGIIILMVILLVILALFFIICMLPGIMSDGSYVTFDINTSDTAVYMDGTYLGSSEGSVYRVPSGNHEFTFHVSGEEALSVSTDIPDALFFTLFHHRVTGMEVNIENTEEIETAVIRRGTEDAAKWSRITEYTDSFHCPPLFTTFAENAVALSFDDVSDPLLYMALHITSDEMLEDFRAALSILENSDVRYTSEGLSTLMSAFDGKTSAAPLKTTVSPEAVYKDEFLTYSPEEFVKGNNGKSEYPLVKERYVSVRTDEFSIASDPVSEYEYALFIKENPYWAKSNIDNLIADGMVDETYLLDADLSLSVKSMLPVRSVSWYAAEAYAAWLSEKTGKNIVLPSDSEWTLAAVSASDKPYTASLLSIDSDNSSPKAMMGQLWEFTSDAFIPLSRLIDQNEVERLSQLYPYDDVIVKGGSWINTPDTVSPDTVGVMDRSACSVYAGFRIGTR